MDQLSKTFGALADPTRRAILARLASGECSVNSLAEPFDMSLPAISKHLRVLEEAGLIVRSRKAQVRPCTLRAQPLKEAMGFVGEFKQFWDDHFDRLETYLAEIHIEEHKND